MKDRKEAFDQCVKTIKKEDLDVTFYLLETDYIPVGFRCLVEERIEQIKSYILETGIYMVEDDFLDYIDDTKVNDTKGLVKLYTRKIVKYPALYIISAIDVCTKLVIESKDMVLSVNEKNKESYLYVKKDGFVRHVYLVFKVGPEDNYDELPKVQFIIKDSKTGIILGFNEQDVKIKHLKNTTLN